VGAHVPRTLRLRSSTPFYDRAKPFALFAFTNYNEDPILSIACRWSTDRSVENSADDRVCYWI